MSSSYIVVRGDSLSSIARKHGIPSWMDIYYHPDNSQFRLKRRNPNLIFPGDVVMIPGGDPELPECLARCQREFEINLHLPLEERLVRLRGCQKNCKGLSA